MMGIKNSFLWLSLKFLMPKEGQYGGISKQQASFRAQLASNPTSVNS